MERRQAGMEDVDGPEAWFRSLPFVTKWWVTSAVGLTCGGNLNVISVSKLIWSWAAVKNHFEIWRLATAFLYMGGPSMHLLFAFFFLYQYSNNYERMGPYNTGGGGGTADYVFCLLVGMAGLLITLPFEQMLFYNPMMGPPILGERLSFYVIYTWSRKFPNLQVTLWVLPLKAVYLPFALIAITVLSGGSPGGQLHGLVIAHMYYFLVDVVPLVHGQDILHTPQFLIDYFGIGNYQPAPEFNNNNVGGGAGGGAWNAPGRVPPPNDPAARGGANNRRGYNWGGGGRTLGSD